MQASKVDVNSHELINQFEKLQCSAVPGNTTNGGTEALTSMPSSPTAFQSKASGSRSISNAGIPTIAPQMTPPPQSRAQTAPPMSGSYYGFSYPYNYQYSNNLVYSNNNSMFPPTIPTVDQNLLFYPPQNNYMRSVSPLPGASSFVQSPAVEEEAAKNTSDKTASACSSPSTHPKVPPRPAGYRHNYVQGAAGTYVYVPHVSLGTSSSSNSLHDVSSGMLSPPPPTITESPENSASFHLQAVSQPTANVSPNIPRKDFNSQLHINIESSDTSAHDWRPFQTYSPQSQAVGQPMPFQLSPNFSGYQPVYHRGDRTVDQVPPNLPVPHPMFVQMPFPPMAYPPPPPPNVYYQVPTSGQILIPSYDFQQYVGQQRHYLNGLRYELRRYQEERDTLKKEITDLKNSLEENSSLPSKSDIEKLNKEISKLRLECYCLCADVDEHYKGKVPLGEISNDFYSCINTGQDGPLHSSTRIEEGGTQAEHPSPRGIPLEEDEENQETRRWTCSKCTFQNHPAISICEICQVGENIACST